MIKIIWKHIDKIILSYEVIVLWYYFRKHVINMALGNLGWVNFTFKGLSLALYFVILSFT